MSEATDSKAQASAATAPAAPTEATAATTPAAPAEKKQGGHGGHGGRTTFRTYSLDKSKPYLSYPINLCIHKWVFIM